MIGSAFESSLCPQIDFLIFLELQKERKICGTTNINNLRFRKLKNVIPAMFVKSNTSTRTFGVCCDSCGFICVHQVLFFINFHPSIFIFSSSLLCWTVICKKLPSSSSSFACSLRCVCKSSVDFLVEVDCFRSETCDCVNKIWRPNQSLILFYRSFFLTSDWPVFVFESLFSADRR